MSNYIAVFAVLTALFYSCADEEKDQDAVYSPNKKIAARVYLNESGEARFDVTYDGKTILRQSKLGVVRDDGDFSGMLTMESVSKTAEYKDQYTLLFGKKKEASYTANEKVFHFQNSDGENMDVIFRISDDGVAFRYHFPGETDDVKTISNENTSYHFPEGTKTWIQPMADPKTGWMRTNPSYEEDYIQEVDIRELGNRQSGWVYPALFQLDGVWALITETAPDRDYCGTRLMHEEGSLEFTVGFPTQQETMNEKEGANPSSTLPWNTPWRIITLGDLGTIVESTLGTDLAEPSKLQDISFVKPGRSSWSWVLLKDDSTIYEVQKRFIDYSAEMGWEYTLIDAEWHEKIGYDSVRTLAEYAAKKDVGLLLWYNSAGPWNDTPYGPRNMLLTKESREKEFSRLKEMGIKGVKVDFFGGDGQDVMSYYVDIFEDAARYDIMVNTHGCTLPRGWHRTYPNLVTMEAVKGMEFCTFAQENANRQPTHSCMLPFTRNVFDPMDFTPVVFSEPASFQRVTANSFELATAVLFLSGVQHYAETDRGMSQAQEHLVRYMKEIPVSWDETRFIDGYPGKLAIIARRTGDAWYIAGINGENSEKKAIVDLSFLKAQTGEIITDETNRKTRLDTLELPEDGVTEIDMLPHGGFVMKFVENE